ncbi:hypothetical protein BpHYR1_034190 [Brachionus plicatilis]|uniref:Uncharacterized protein n=1 Tax=Brachionus plicatilis TaxID=10195 RepID=A0A3M7RVF3_BRAPC|nr:hypothetical protein BpHYR1_034190 [Brachionus plicatilis]
MLGYFVNLLSTVIIQECCLLEQSEENVHFTNLYHKNLKKVIDNDCGVKFNWMQLPLCQIGNVA